VTALRLFPVRHFTEIDSTNLECARRAVAGEQGPLWLVADVQTAGRGRLERQWSSEPGGVYATLLYPAGVPVARVAELGFVMALAVHDALSEFVSVDVLKLKWPNDCLADDAKISGILCETCGHDPLRLALGVGINVKVRPESIGYPTRCVADYYEEATVETVFAALQVKVQNWLSVWTGGFEEIRRAWLVRSYAVGTKMQVAQMAGVYVGQYVGLAKDGALLIEDAAGEVRKIFAGDARVVRSEAA
jgi:BirA family transcriptional regulator, biotin operon repressor / biotin---[acetyl-CoA-carboxylase] ligase